MKKIFFCCFKFCFKAQDLVFKKVLSVFPKKQNRNNFRLLRWLNRKREAFFEVIYKKLAPKGIISVNVPDGKLYVDGKDRSIAHDLLMNGIIEKYETELFKKYIKKMQQ